jgi:hypothetical protein
MKRILLVAGVGLSLFTVTMAMSPVKTVQAGDHNTYATDTVPKKDTSKPKPKPDSVQIMQQFNK